MGVIKVDAHRGPGGNLAVLPMIRFLFMSILFIQSHDMSLAVYVCFKQCVRTLILMSSDTWLYSSSVLVPRSEKLSYYDIGEKLGGMGVGWAPFTYCLEGFRLVCGKWLPSLSPICSFRHVRTITIIYMFPWVSHFRETLERNVGMLKGSNIWATETPEVLLGTLSYHLCFCLMLFTSLKVPGGS